MRQLHREQGVSRFVEGSDLLLLVGENHRLAFHAHEDFVLGQLEVVLQNSLAVLTSRAQSGLVDHVGQVSAGESRSPPSQDAEFHVFGERNLAGVHTQNFFAPANVGTIHHDAPIEAAGAEQCRIKHIRTIRRGHENDALVRLEAVHLDQQLVQSLLALVVSTAEASTTVTSHGVDFVDENDAGSVLLALLEQVTNTACAYAYEHLYEIGP